MINKLLIFLKITFLIREILCQSCNLECEHDSIQCVKCRLCVHIDCSVNGKCAVCIKKDHAQRNTAWSEVFGHSDSPKSEVSVSSQQTITSKRNVTRNLMKTNDEESLKIFQNSFKPLKCQELVDLELKKEKFATNIKNEIISHAAGEIIKISNTWLPNTGLKDEAARMLLRLYPFGLPFEEVIVF